MAVTYKIFLRTDQTNKDGTNTVCLRVSQQRKTKYFSLRIYVHSKDWNDTKNSVKKSDSKYFIKNKKITKYDTKADTIITDYFYNDKYLSFEVFEKQLFNNLYANNSFYDFIDSEIEQSNQAKETKKGHITERNKLKSYKKELSFNEIDISFLRKYENFLLEKNNKNTTNKSLIFIKTFINRAIKQNIYTEKNPFENFPISKVTGNRDYLTKNEIDKLNKLLDNKALKSGLKNVLKYFLFACYTGLRYSDIELLKYKHIVSNVINNEEVKLIKITQKKTKKEVKIPLLTFAENLIQSDTIYNKEKHIFRVFTGQVTNRHLKELALLTGISKQLTFHVARHTFATISIENGIPIEVVKELLGQSDIRTTLIYAKVSDQLKIKEMNKNN